MREAVREGGMTPPPPAHVYGPVPSRRLGRSLGADIVPYKVCTYDCVYCQIGRTTDKTLDRREYVAVDEVIAGLKEKLAGAPPPDYIGVAGSGEPTLNSRIGELIRGIKRMTRVPVAVLTNGSLLSLPDVRDALMEADLVLPSLDAGDERLFRLVNRPHPGIGFDAMVDGIAEFTARFPRDVWLEVFLCAGLTGTRAEAKKLAALARRIRPARVQLNTVGRPPCEESARAVPPAGMKALASIFRPPAEVIAGAAGGPPAGGGRAATDDEILELLRRRPCTARGVAAGLGLHVAEAVKRLEALAARGAAEAVRLGGVVHHRAAK